MRRWLRAFVSVIIMTLAGLPSALAEDGLRNCIVSRISGGEVTLDIGGTVGAATEGQMVPVGTIVTTGPDSRLEIGCDDGVTVTVGAASRIDLAALAGPKGEDRNILLRLFGGIVGIDAPNRTWGKFEVETDLAIASVRSTAWLVEASPEKGTGIFVKRGKVAVRAGDDQALLAEGEGVDIPPAIGTGVRGVIASGTLAAEMKPVVKWGDKRLKATDEALGFGWTDG
jgi:hypothetical protein